MIHLIRHMQSVANIKHITGGDYPLTDKGLCDAEILKKQIKLKPDFLVVSPLIRAQQTAKILFPEKEFVIDNEFREISFGDFEGTLEDTLPADNEFLKVYNTAPSRLHEITNGDVIKDRADKAIIKMLDYLSKGNVVIVCHDTLIRAIICRLRGESLDNMPKYKPLLQNGSILSLNLSTRMEITNYDSTVAI